jgi:glycosyltransferase involved in cell wall biosynthesis
MLNNKSIAVVIPAFNEANQIKMVLEGIPDFVDRIVVVDDNSKDSTIQIVKQYLKENNSDLQIPSEISKKLDNSPYNKADLELRKKSINELNFFTPHHCFNENSIKERIILIKHDYNAGVGAAISTGYKWCKDHAIDCSAVMAGDGQMDPLELKSICEPIVKEDIDYVKGNRLIHQSAWVIIPKVRFFGNSILSILTKVASGYWHVSDTQTGYTAISNHALNAIPIYKIYKRYGMPNDILIKLNIAFCTIREIKIKPVYSVGEKSKLKILKVSFPILFLLIKGFIKRLWVKYLFRDFHPLFLLYNIAFLTFIADSYFLYHLLVNFLLPDSKTPTDFLIIFIFLTISGFQSLLFAMWMDIQNNDHLRK